MSTGPYYCYIIACGERTYNGYTNNLSRRIRQHCGIIKGGAKATSGKGPWHYISIMTSPDWSAVRAMQVEWTHKYPTRKKPRPRLYQGPRGRMLSLESVCKHVPEPVTLYVHADYLSFVQSLSFPPTVDIRLLETHEDITKNGFLTHTEREETTTETNENGRISTDTIYESS